MKIENKKYIDPESIIAVFDLDTSTESMTTRNFLRECEKSEKLVLLSKDIPRSIIITDSFVYLSGLNVKTFLSKYSLKI